MAAWPSQAFSAGGEASDSDVEAVREMFGEDLGGDPSKRGIPGEKFRGKSVKELASVIDVDFASKLYKKPNALAAIARVFSGKEYEAINLRLGEVRNQLNVQIWAEIVEKFGVRIELNDAGKKGGARSDLDKAMYTDATRLDGVDVAPDKIHGFLIGEHEKLWQKKTNGLKPADFDCMHFPGDGMMADWRMSNASWKEFSQNLSRSIANLGTTEGAYFIPGAYKTQVYTRYHLEGKTQVFHPTASNPADLPNFLQSMVDDLPPGVFVSEDLSTSEYAKLYEYVPFSIDRTGAFGSAVQNVLAATQVADSIKNAKYHNRWGDTSLAHITNLEVDFRRLILQGKTDILGYHLKKLFSGDLAKQMLPPALQDVKEVQRVIELLNQIEIDKTIKQYNGKAKPKSWSNKWRNYKSADINKTKVKLEYYKKEVSEVRKAFSQDTMPSDEKVAELAEKAFKQKAEAIGKLAVVTSARNVFRDVFSREGFSRQQHLHGTDAATRLLVERVKELHASLIFIDDAALIESILKEVPPEAQRAINKLAKISTAQRKLVTEHRSLIDSIPAEWASLRPDQTAKLRNVLRDSLSESDTIIKQLMRDLDLGLDPDQARNVEGLTRLRLGDLAVEYARQEVALTMRDQLAKLIREGRIRTSQGAQESLKKLDTFFNVELHRQMTSGAFFSEYYGNFFDVGTVDSAGKVFTAWATGNHEGMIHEARDTVLSNIPYGGKAFSLTKSLKDLEKGKSAPTLLFLTQTFLANTAHGAKYGALIGMLNALYGLEQSLFQLGWHFYGKPTQGAAVSLILMGDLSGFHGDEDAVRIPSFKDPETMGLLKANAILKNRVRVPRFSPDFRRKFLRAHFLTDANRTATTIGRSVPGQFSSWEEDRNNTLAKKYYRNWQYWFRRLFFYQEITNEFTRWARQLSGDENWQRFDSHAPGFMVDLPRAEQMRVYDTAFESNVGAGGSWDHETAWLMRYLYGWVDEWEAAQKEHGEVMYYLDSVGLAGGWRKAVVDSLVTMYREGEVIEHRQWEAQIQGQIEEHKKKHQMRDQLKKAREEVEKRANGGYKAVGQEILDTHGAKRLETFLQLEALKWDPKLVEDVQAAVVSAAKKQPEYTPAKATLVVAMPRPVGKMGKNLPVEVFVKGDSKDFPEDINLEVGYEPGQVYEGRRPRAVLKDDVIMLFREEIDDEDLLVVEHKVSYKVSSASNPGFNLEASKTIYWVERLKDEEDDESGDSITGDDGGEGTGPTIDLDEMRRLARLAKESEEKADQHCKQAESLAEQVDSVTEQLTESLTSLNQAREDLLALLAKLNAIVPKLPPLPPKIIEDGKELGKNRDISASKSESTCLLKDRIADVSTPDEQDKVWSDLQASHKSVREAYTKGLEHYLKLKRDFQQIETAKELLSEVSTAFSNYEKEREKFTALAEAAQRSLEQGENQSESAAGQVTQISDKQDRGAPLLEDAETTLKDSTNQEQRSLLDEMRGLYGQIVNSKSAVEQCPDKTKTSLATATQALKQVTDKFEAADIEGISAETRKIVTDAYAQTEATGSLADPFWKSIEARLKRSEQCLQEARSMLRKIVTVPQVVNLKAPEAIRAIKSRSLKEVALGGNPADSKAEEFLVYEQDLAAGSRVFVDTPLTIRVYGKFKEQAPAVRQVTVPDVRGLSRDQAMTTLTRLGLKVAYRYDGKPQTARDENKVRKQVPAAGSKVEPGSDATVWVFENYVAAAKASPTPVLEGEGPFYVVFNAFFPDVKKNNPDQKYSDFLRGLTIRNIRLKHDKDWVFVLHVSGDGLNYYSRDQFREGDSYATKIMFGGRDPKQPKGFSIPGAFLFKVAYVLDNSQSIYTRYKKARDPKSFTGNFMKADSARGLFVQTIQADQGAFKITGGPLVKGWSTSMKQQNLDFMKKVADMFDCFIATASYGPDLQFEKLYTFRRFRDEVLRKHPAGKRLVQRYYHYGPHFAFRILAQPELKPYVQAVLDPLAEVVDGLDYQDLSKSIPLTIGLSGMDGVASYIFPVTTKGMPPTTEK